MNQPRFRISVRKLLVEFSVVVVGVFLALAAESWWSDRQERAFEREVREDMVAEFEANLRILEADLAGNEESRLFLAEISSMPEAELLAIPDQEMNDRYRAFPSWQGFDPEMGFAQALVESGNLHVIRDRDLRLGLSRWAGLLEEKRRFNLQAVDAQLDIIVPTVAALSADEIWTAAERRHAQTLYRTMALLHSYVLDNQQRLRSAARDVLLALDNGN